jgi:murein L,D-transpeptidase YcbB/YkuD
MKKYLAGVVCASVFAFAFVAPVAKAETTDTTPTIASLMEILQGLLKQVEELQKKLQETRGEIQTVQKEIKSGLREGMTDEDVKKIQELLASDSTLYPRGLITGYYGPLTNEAVKRFQERHGLTVTGMVDDETRDYLEEYYSEYKGNRGAAALWALEKRQEMKKRIAERKMMRDEMKDKDNDDDDDDEDEDDDDDDDDDDDNDDDDDDEDEDDE